MLGSQRITITPTTRLLRIGPVVVGVVVLMLAAGCVGSASAADAGSTHRNTRACDRPPPGAAGCLAIRHDTVGPSGRVVARARPSPAYYAPSDIRAAYGLRTASSHGRTVAIVDAYDDPKAEADLGVYRRQFGLPACTTANGCFTKVNQTRRRDPPQADGGWAQEISLDLDMVSATCPDCNIRLVEATATTSPTSGPP